MERARTERELAFQRAYDVAWQRLYPNEMPVDEFTLRPRNAFNFTDEGALQARLTVHVAVNGCERCDSTVRELLAQGAQMDIFVLDSDGAIAPEAADEIVRQVRALDGTIRARVLL